MVSLSLFGIFEQLTPRASRSSELERSRLSPAMLPDVARANLVGIRRKVHIEHVRIFADGSVCRVAEIFPGVPAENWQEASADDAVSLAEGKLTLFIVAGDRSASQ